jgi:hypothetical protein
VLNAFGRNSEEAEKQYQNDPYSRNIKFLRKLKLRSFDIHFNS